MQQFLTCDRAALCRPALGTATRHTCSSAPKRFAGARPTSTSTALCCKRTQTWASSAQAAPYPSKASSSSGEEGKQGGKSILAAVAQDVLAGFTVSLSMVPEALAMTVIAGVAPIVGLQSAAVMAIVAAIAGSQHISISGAAGSVAVVAGSLSAAHGPEFLFAAIIVAGILQVRPRARHMVRVQSACGVMH